jgi:hypothetical protein
MWYGICLILITTTSRTEIDAWSVLVYLYLIASVAIFIIGLINNKKENLK